MEDNHMLTQFDAQQLSLMKGRIHVFEQTKPFLDSLLSITRSLEEILDSLKKVDKSWIEAFRTEWWELEFTSALMMDNEVEELTKEDHYAVSQALQNMKNLIEDLLKKGVEEI